MLKAPVPWMTVYRISSAQNTRQMVFQYAMQQTIVPVPEHIEEMMLLALTTGVKAHVIANKVLTDIVKALDGHGIRSVLLKGQGVASYYATPYLRQCGDIDLYVGKENFDRACRIVGTMALALRERGDKHQAYDFGNNLSVEIHRYTEVLPNRKLNAYYQTISDDGTREGLVPVHFDGVDILTPEDTFNAFYIFHHLWHHVSGMGMGLRQFCDWAAFLHAHRGQLDEARLEKWLSVFHLMRVWKVMGCLAVDRLGLEHDAVPFLPPQRKDRKRLRKPADAFLNLILEEGDNRAYKFEREKNTFQHKAGSLAYIFSKFYKLLPIFPWQAVLFLFRNINSGIAKFVRKLAEETLVILKKKP